MMDKRQELVQTIQDNYDDILHYGVPGMKWGVRKSGASSSSGKKKSPNSKKISSRQNLLENMKSKFSKTKEVGDKVKTAKEIDKEHNQEILKAYKKRSQMSDDELRSATNRLQLENAYKREVSAATQDYVNAKGKKLKVAKTILKTVTDPKFIEATTGLYKTYTDVKKGKHATEWTKAQAEKTNAEANYMNAKTQASSAEYARKRGVNVMDSGNTTFQFTADVSSSKKKKKKS